MIPIPESPASVAWWMTAQRGTAPSPEAELPQSSSPLMGDVNVAAESMGHYEVFEVGERVHCPY
jgi:hypothetical protein